MIMRPLLFTLIAVGILAGGCAKQLPMEADPFFDSFYDKTRHIMSSEEIEIYRHLPDRKAKEEFIDEFWAKRDPDPSTEENESREDFEERIEFANRWFNERRGKDRGWDTLRGRILLQLGFPDERRWGHQRGLDDHQTTRHLATEVWYYYRHQLVLIFADRKGYGQFELETLSPNLLTAIEHSRYAIDSALFPNVKHAFKFSAEFKEGQVDITIPAKRLLFDEEGEQLSARLSFTVYVYKDYRKIDTIVREMSYTEKKVKLLEMKEITLRFPFIPTEPGLYHLDIVGKDLGADQRFRNFCQIKIK